MEQRSPQSDGNFGIRGEIKVVFNRDGKKETFVTENFIVNKGLSCIKDTLVGTPMGSLYRMGVGEGGWPGGVRTLPNDSWHSYEDLVSPVYSKELDAGYPETNFVDNKWAIELKTTFTSSELSAIWSSDLKIDEACVILGDRVVGIQEGSSAVGGDNLFAYRTFTSRIPFNRLVATDVEIYWTIYLEKI